VQEECSFETSVTADNTTLYHNSRGDNTPDYYSEDAMLQDGRSRDRFSVRWIFSNLPNPSGRTMVLESTQRLTKMSTRNLKKKKETWD
jgi:hypothetical protein